MTLGALEVSSGAQASWLWLLVPFVVVFVLGIFLGVALGIDYARQRAMERLDEQEYARWCRDRFENGGDGW